MQSIQVDLANEKERSQVREQEAFAARYELVGVQEELAKMQEQIKLVEQERDALRTIAKNEEVARIAAEGQIPLPISTEDDEFASPKKKSRKSLDLITRSAASEEEMEMRRQKVGEIVALDTEEFHGWLRQSGFEHYERVFSSLFFEVWACLRLGHPGNKLTSHATLQSGG